MPLPTLVVFDLAGTTIEDDDLVATCLAHAACAVGVPADRARANGVMGLPKPVAIARLIAQLEGGAPPPLGSARVCTAMRVFEQEILRRYRAPGAVVPIDGIEDVFEMLRDGGAKIAIDTGFSSIIAGAILERLGWIADGRVDACVASDEVVRGRPAPDLIVEAMRRCGVTDVRSVAKIGDTPADLGEGTSAGCGWVIGVTYGTHERDELAPHPHTQLVDDARALPGVLGFDGAGSARTARARSRPSA